MANNSYVKVEAGRDEHGALRDRPFDRMVNRSGQGYDTIRCVSAQERAQSLIATSVHSTTQKNDRSMSRSSRDLRVVG
jgi:hypothetical protein